MAYALRSALLIVGLLMGGWTGAVSGQERPGDAPAEGQATWARQCADCPQDHFWVSEQALALDSAGHPHVVYGGEAVYYARHDGAAWQVEEIDGKTPWAFWNQVPPSLVLDGEDRPHVVYVDTSGEYLVYAVKTAEGWQRETIDHQPPPFGFMTSDTTLVLDAEGTPWVAYSRWGALQLATRREGTWQIEVVDDSWYFELYFGLAVDGTGTPHISYMCGWASQRNMDLRYATRRGGAWVVETVADGGLLGEYDSIAVDAAGIPHITYRDADHEDVRHAVRGEAGWEIEVIESGGGYWLGSTTTLIDAQGMLHVSYSVNAGARYAYRVGDGWAIEPIASGTHQHTSMALDAENRPRVAYFSWSEFALQLATRSAGGWAIEVVDRPGLMGKHASLALDGAGQPRVSYTEYHRTGELRYARATGPAWTAQTVDRIGTAGGYTDLALDAGGGPHIAYYDGVGGDLRYARLQGSTWVTETADAEGDVGMYASAGLGPGGGVRVSYYDASHGDLKVAFRDGGSWTAETVDAEGDTGLYTSLAVDGAGEVHVAYYDGSAGDLRYAHGSGAGWSAETVDWAGDVGRYASLALDGEGQPQIAYYDATNRDLKYARWTGEAWEAVTVASKDDVGSHASLALDGAGRPSIAYTDATHLRLAFSSWTGEGWAHQVADGNWNVGRYASLALDGAGHARVAYLDAGYGYLRVAAVLWAGVFFPQVTRYK
jgi:hypothetical protein